MAIQRFTEKNPKISKIVIYFMRVCVCVCFCAFVCVHMCVSSSNILCVREGERERDRQTDRKTVTDRQTEKGGRVHWRKIKFIN